MTEGSGGARWQGSGERAGRGRVPAIGKELGEGGRANPANGSVCPSSQLQVVSTVPAGVCLIRAVLHL